MDRSQKAPVKIFTGSDAYLAFEKAREFVYGQAREHDLEVEGYEGDAENLEELIQVLRCVYEAISTPSLFGNGRVVWWKRVRFLTPSPHSRNTLFLVHWERLLELLAKLQTPRPMLVVHAVALDRRAPHVKDLLALASIKELDRVAPGSEGEVQEVLALEQRLRALGWDPEPGVAERLFWATEGESGLLDQELHKLAAFQGDSRRLTLPVIEQVTSDYRQGSLWSFCEAVLQGELKEAWVSLGRLLAQGETEMGVATVLSGEIRLAVVTACLQEAGLLRVVRRGRFPFAEVEPQGEALLPKKRSGGAFTPWRLGRIAQRSRRKPVNFWISALERVHRLHGELMSQGDRRGVLESAILDLCRILA
jgi:DNA polymerase III delta subunit